MAAALPTINIFCITTEINGSTPAEQIFGEIRSSGKTHLPNAELNLTLFKPGIQKFTKFDPIVIFAANPSELESLYKSIKTLIDENVIFIATWDNTFDPSKPLTQKQEKQFSLLKCFPPFEEENANLKSKDVEGLIAPGVKMLGFTVSNIQFEFAKFFNKDFTQEVLAKKYPGAAIGQNQPADHYFCERGLRS